MSEVCPTTTQTFPRFHGLALELERLLTALAGVSLAETSTSAEIADAVQVLLQQLVDVADLLELLEAGDQADPIAKELLDLTFMARLSLPGHQRELAQLDGADRWSGLLAVSRITEEARGLLSAMQAVLVRAGYLAPDALARDDDAQRRDSLRARRHVAEVYVAAVRGGEPDEAQATSRLRRIGNALTLLLGKSSHALRIEELHTLRGLRVGLVEALRARADAQTLLHLWADAQATLQLLVAMSARQALQHHDAELAQRVQRELDDLDETADLTPWLRELLPLCGRSARLDAILTAEALPSLAELREGVASLGLTVPPRIAPRVRRRAS